MQLELKETDMGKRLTLPIVAVLVLICSSPASAQEKTTEFGITGGLLLAGEVYLAEFDTWLDTDTSLLVRLTYDSFQIPSLGFGGFLNFASVGVADESGTMVTIGGAIKPRWYLGAAKDQTIDVGLNLGYRSVSSDAFTEDVSGLALNLSAEYMKPLGDRQLIVDVGFITQPTGGNDATDVTWDPIFYLTAGITF
jgi:hypothetical protein